MTQSSLDFSQRPELALHAEAIASVSRVADSLELDLLIVGAFARDIHLVYVRALRGTGFAFVQSCRDACCL
jgi:hypothetical protein